MNQIKAEQARVSLCEMMGIDSKGQQQRLDFVGLGANEIALLKELAPVIEREADAIVEVFYQNVGKFPELVTQIEQTKVTVEQLKQTQRDYLLELFSGDYGSHYFERRLRVGIVHHRIGLAPRWYMGSFAIYLSELARVVMRHYRWRPGQGIAALQAITRVVMLDAELGIDTYIHSLKYQFDNISHDNEALQARIAHYLELVEGVAEGDLTQRIHVNGNDSIAQLGKRLNYMVDSLAQMASQVTESSSAMLQTVREVNGSVTSQASGAAQQAASINQTSATLEEINATSQQNLEKATSLRDVSERARVEGDNGLRLVESAVKAMHEINNSMKEISSHITSLNDRIQQIGEITETVGDLAQQSKMLALNASIEAARAGDAGRGFAVVADEVRELAEQSRQASAQVQGILDDIRSAATSAVHAVDIGSRSADEGAEQIEQAGTVLRDLNHVIHENALASQQIMAAVRQESAGIDQIRIAIDEINHVTAHFASATRETDQAASKLTNYATMLQSLARQFRIGELHLDFEKARAAHHAWLQRMERFVQGHELVNMEEAVSHRHCELGRWLDGDGRRLYGDLAVMQRIEEPHRRMHEMIREIVVKVNNRTPFDGKLVMAELSRFSAEIITLLDEIENEASQRRHHNGGS
ncbi:MAG: CZB domain-containing protein [Gammaproteobacteria bacterium]|nr:CZB domain-containing protein [Gammaproteobacteria bacterium]